MKLNEQLNWILECPASEVINKKQELSKVEYLEWYEQNSENRRTQNKALVKAIGQTCNAAGWSTLNLDQENTDDLLQKIKYFCGQRGYLLRGEYIRRFSGLDSEWYKLNPSSGIINLQSAPNTPWTKRVYATKAYQNKGQHLLKGGMIPMVSESFREVCIRHDIQCGDFCWIEDKGQYRSEQYFLMYPQNMIHQFALPPNLGYCKDKDTIAYCPFTKELQSSYEKLGGWLPQLHGIMDQLSVGPRSIPNAYPRLKMPKSGFAYVCWDSTWSIDETSAFREIYVDTLIHKSTANILIEEKVLSKKQLSEVLLYDELPDGYQERKSIEVPLPSAQYRIAMLEKHDAFIEHDKRLPQCATEKEALQLLRKAKYHRKDEMSKGMKRESVSTLHATAYEPLAPYYSIENGGVISDEYELLPHEKAQLATTELRRNTENEDELFSDEIGSIFAVCPDGDVLMLLNSGQVIRCSHAEPVSIEEWPSLAQFFVDCIE